LRAWLTKSTSTGAASSAPSFFWSAIVTVTSMLASATAASLPPGALAAVSLPPGVPLAVLGAVATVPTLAILPSTDPPPGTVTVTALPFLASAWSATSSSTVTSLVVPV
jgi:hypothetical protein